jgi:AcrR family transcriptional regulator
MRITAQTKSATRKRILQSARRLFSDNGYDTTTTRDIAVAAQIATGTLFNYFPTKEAIVASLAREAIDDALASDIPPADTLEEDLFALVAAGLRKLRPLRRHLPSLLETSLSPLAATRPDDDATAFRLLQLDRVAALAAAHGFGPLSPTALQLYWTLYTGALLFWAGDESRGQQETLALLDDSVDMFVGWLRQQGTTPPGPKGS